MIRLYQSSWRAMLHYTLYGVGAMIYRMADGTERPIVFASRTLAKSEKNYTQLEMVALPLVYKAKKVHRYLYSQKFTLLIDHQPLIIIFNSKIRHTITSSSSITTLGFVVVSV